MPNSTDPTSEDLLAGALAAFDAGGETALEGFISSHPEQATVLQRGIARCRQMGLLSAPTSRSFPERLDDYRLLRRIGGGGMGVVYEAEHVTLGRKVALKLIRPELLYFEGARERFRREIEAIAKLAHPAIVPVFASGEQDGLPYFAMELLAGATAEDACNALQERDPSSLEGADLRDVVGRSSGAEASGELFAGAWWKACVRLGIQVALGIRHAHLRGIVHRDLKPSNLMITPHGQAIVLDFGVAKLNASQELTRSGASPGSPAFMSPEQVRGEATDERTDIYSLGATLWNLLALDRPFGGPKVLEQIQQGSLRALRARNRNLPRELEVVLRTAMDRDRERRYGDMGAFAADLQAVLARKPIAARPLPLHWRAIRWCQRHRVTAAALGALACGAVVMLGVLFWQQSRANAALAREQKLTQESLETTLDALHSVLVKLGNEGLRQVPLAERIAHETLQDAAKLFRALLAKHPEDARVRLLGGRALHALSMSFERQGRLEESVKTVREAIDVLEDPRLARSASLYDIRACARMSLASTYADLRDDAAALAAFEEAERDFVASAEADPACIPTSLRGRANLRVTLSIVLDEQREPERVEAALREAVDLHEHALEHGADKAKDPTLRITYLCNLAKFLARRSRDGEAREIFERAHALSRELEPSLRVWPPPEASVAEIEEGLGNLLVRQKDPAAETWLKQSLETREKLVREFPENPLFRIQLGGAIHNYGLLVQGQEGRLEEALGWFQRARTEQEAALERSPANRQGRIYLGQHLKSLGNVYVKLRRGREVLEAARSLAALELEDRDAPYRAALYFLHARRFLAKEPAALEGIDCVEAAVQQLELAERYGFDRAEELENAFFAPLREHPEWEALRARIAGRKAGSGGR